MHRPASLGLVGQMAVSRKFFETQVMALLGPLYCVARRLNCSDADTENLVAEALTRAWKALASLECEEESETWHFRILNNTFVSDLRRAEARPKLESSAGDDGVDDEPDFSLFEQMRQPFRTWLLEHAPARRTRDRARFSP